MASITATIADAVVGYINDQEYAFKFEARRRPYPTLTIKEADGLVVSVLLGPRTSERFTRAGWQTKYRCYVVVQRKLSADLERSQVEADELTQLTEALEASVETQDRFAGMYFESYDDTAERLPFNMDLLHDNAIFAAVFGMVFTN